MARDSENDSGGADEPAPVDNASKDRISDALKRVYDDVANEPLPSNLADLLEKLKNGDKN